MSKTFKRVISATFALAASLLASAIMIKLTPNDSWMAFVGWTIFFLAVQSPIFLLPQNSSSDCTAWLTRLWRQN
jgi:hypothetical protein